MENQPRKISRQELYERVWKTTLKKIAEELGTTYVELARVCDELNVPRPVHGHWQRLKLGLPVEVLPLPEPEAGMPLESLLQPKGKGRTSPSLGTRETAQQPAEPATEQKGDEAVQQHQDDQDANASAKIAAAPANSEPGATSAPNDPKSEAPVTIRYTREELHKAIWSTPCQRLAAKLGVSDVALAKTCRRLGVPRPPRGYWARLQAGEKMSKARLPQAREGEDVVVTFNVAANLASRERWAADNVLTAGRGGKPGRVELRPKVAELHPIAERHRRALEKAKPDKRGFVSVSGKDLFCCDLSVGCVPRLLKALDAIICELEDRDYEFEPGDDEYAGLEIIRDGDGAALRWSEDQVELEREPTEADKRKPSWTWQLKETKATGELTIEVCATGLRGKRKWTEGEGRPLEELLGIVVEKLEAVFRGFEERRQREAEWKARCEEERRLRVAQEAKEAERAAQREREAKERERVKRHESKLAKIAESRSENLASAAQLWVEAQSIDAFIDYCEAEWRRSGKGELTKHQAEWLTWARREASKAGPMAKGYPDPGMDGSFDAGAVPVGGPYPETRDLGEVAEEPKEPPTEPEVKTVFVESPRPRDQFPYWLLHRRR